MARQHLAQRAQFFLILALGASWFCVACSTGTTLVNGQDPFAAQGGNTLTTSPNQGTGSATAPVVSGNSGSGNSTTGTGNGNATVGSAATGQNVAVGVEVDTGGSALDSTFWLGAQAAVSALAPNAPVATRVVVGSYSASGVSLAYNDDGQTALAKGRNGVVFAGDGGTEAWLTQLDAKGAQVLVEVQPGSVDLPTLAAEVMQHYMGHSSVVGVSLNLAYYGSKSSNLGSTKLSDKSAAAVVAAVQQVAPQALIYLRHYSSTYMPPTTRTGLGFALDAQGFSGLSDMGQVYGAWATTFAPAPVQFIIGGSKDTAWACQLPGGAQDWVAAAQKAGGNVSGVLWSAQSITQLYPTNLFSCLGTKLVSPAR